MISWTHKEMKEMGEREREREYTTHGKRTIKENFDVVMES
jgi:hypothetical protein